MGFQAGAHMEGLVHQHEDEKWKRNITESKDADHIDVMSQLSDVNLKQRLMDSKLTECHDDVRAMSMMLQKVRQLHVWLSKLLNNRD